MSEVSGGNSLNFDLGIVIPSDGLGRKRLRGDDTISLFASLTTREKLPEKGGSAIEKN